MSKTLAILVSDVHLSERPPVARAGEPDWYDTMARYLGELRVLSGSLMYGPCPIIYAGDIFDRWNSTPELINFAIEHLPKGFAIPGQHDLPNHSYKEIKRSAYWTLVEADILENLEPYEGDEVTSGYHVGSKGLTVYPFPWGVEVTPPPSRHEDRGDLLLAVIHSFIWTKETGYPGAPKDSRLPAWRKKLQGYDVAHFGDNHKTVIAPNVTPIIYNPGSLMRRKSDEIGHRPQVGLLKEDGTVESHYLDTSLDKIGSDHIKVSESKEFDSEDFLETLRSLDQDSLDFRETVLRHLVDRDVDPEVRKMLLEAMEEV